MKRYTRASISPQRIESKKKFIQGIITKIRRGTASIAEIDRACESVVWLWKWKHIDRATMENLCDRLSNAMEGIDDEPLPDWDDDSAVFRGE